MKFHNRIQNLNTDINDIKLLPFCHTTDYHTYLNDIIVDYEGHIFKGNPIKYFEEKNVICFYYGKAKYYSKTDISTNYTSNPPVTLVFSENILDQTARVFPFDTGGFEFLKMHDSLANFQCEEKAQFKSFILHFIKIFYDNNDNYLKNCRYCALKESDFIDFFMRDMIKLYKADLSDTTSFDERAYTLEIHLDFNEVSLVPETVILPDSYFTNEANITELKSRIPHEIKCEVYESCATELMKCHYNMQAKVREVITNRLKEIA